METIVKEITGWIAEAGEKIRRALDSEIEISEKTSRKDLVTNIDKEIQQFIIEKIKVFDPDAKILAEEDGYNQEDISDGRVFIIDPIDGTLNFVLEKANFCIMLAVFEEGIGKLGFIYDVMENQLYWGGSELGVFCNEKKLLQPANLSLEESLVGMNAFMYGNNQHHAYDIGEKSMGIRCSGCAGLEMIAMLKGQHNAYISRLCPWDYAPGCVLLDAFGFRYSSHEGRALRFDGREYFFAGTPKTYEEMMGVLLK